MFIMQYTCSIIPIIINIYFSSKHSWPISSSAKQAYNVIKYKYFLVREHDNYVNTGLKTELK